MNDKKLVNLVKDLEVDLAYWRWVKRKSEVWDGQLSLLRIVNEFLKKAKLQKAKD